MTKAEDIRVLVVDDEDDFLEPISYWLKMQGYQVWTAMSGKEMLDILDEQEVDVIFLDVKMQPMDGYECLREIKERNPKQSVIMLTVQDSPIREGKARSMGADGFFYKGLEYKQAAYAIDKILEAKKIEREG